MTYEEMTVAELEKKNNELELQNQKIKEERRVIARVMSKKRMHEEGLRKIKQIGKEQAGEIHQIVESAGGIESLEKLGEPGK